MQQRGAQKQIGWLDWFSNLVLQLEQFQGLQMRWIQGPWWQALCGSDRRVVLERLICPWCPWNKPAYMHSEVGSHSAHGVPLLNTHKVPQPFFKTNFQSGHKWPLFWKKNPQQWQHYDVCRLNKHRQYVRVNISPILLKGWRSDTTACDQSENHFLMWCINSHSWWHFL